VVLKVKTISSKELSLPYEPYQADIPFPNFLVINMPGCLHNSVELDIQVHIFPMIYCVIGLVMELKFGPI
jgi:hypothetical protein